MTVININNDNWSIIIKDIWKEFNYFGMEPEFAAFVARWLGSTTNAINVNCIVHYNRKSYFPEIMFDVLGCGGIQLVFYSNGQWNMRVVDDGYINNELEG